MDSSRPSGNTAAESSGYLGANPAETRGFADQIPQDSTAEIDIFHRFFDPLKYSKHPHRFPRMSPTQQIQLVFPCFPTRKKEEKQTGPPKNTWLWWSPSVLFVQFVQLFILIQKQSRKGLFTIISAGMLSIKNSVYFAAHQTLPIRYPFKDRTKPCWLESCTKKIVHRNAPNWQQIRTKFVYCTNLMFTN